MLRIKVGAISLFLHVTLFFLSLIHALSLLRKQQRNIRTHRPRFSNPLYLTLLEPTLYVFDGKIFLGHYEQNEKGVIYVFNSNGKKLYDIKPEYEKIIFTEKHKEAYKKEFVTQAQKEFYETNKRLFKYSGYFPERQWFQVVDEKIYIQTYKKNKTGNKTEFLILDLKGKLIKKVMLPLKYASFFNPYFYSIKNGKLYQIVEDDDEQWGLHITEIE